MYLHTPALEAGSWWRVDTASGTNTPTTVYAHDGADAIPTALGASGSTVRGDVNRDGLAVFWSSASTLYCKELTYQGAPTGTVVTSTGVTPSAPVGGAPVDIATISTLVAALPTTYASVGQARVDVTGKYGNNLAAAIAAEGHGKHFIISSPMTLPGSSIAVGTHDVIEATPGLALSQSADVASFAIAAGAEKPVLSNLRIANSFTGTRTTYDIDCVNPFKPVFENVEIALSQSSLGKGGIHIYKDAGQGAGLTQCFMPMLTDVWIRNGVLVVEDVTDGKMQNSYAWGTYTGAAGTIQLTRSSNWTFENVDVVPPQGDAGGYLIGALSNLSIVGGLMDGSYDTIMTGWGIKSSDYVRGLIVTAVKFYNLGRGGITMTDLRRSSFVGNVFVQNNKADASYPDIQMSNAQGNVFIGNSHGAPNARTNKGQVYVEDNTSTDNVVDLNAMEYNNGSHYYSVPLATIRNGSTLGSRNRPDVAWPFTGLLTKGADYTVDKTDLFNGYTIHASNTMTLTLPSAGSVHSGNTLPVKNVGTGLVTVATVSAQAIEGVGTSLVLQPGRAVTLQSTGSGWQIIGAKSMTPAVISPPLSTLATISSATWPTANLAIFQRFTVPETASYRYVNCRVDISSGNYHLAVVRLSGAGLTSYTRVMNSGVVATPTAGDQHVDLGAALLSAGEYAVAVWFDNTTATTRIAANSGVSSMRLSAETSGLTTGIPASGTLAWASTRFLGGVTVEQDV